MNKVNVKSTCGKIAAITFISAALFTVAGCASSRCGSPYAEYDGIKELKVIELKRTSQSWDGVELPDYLKGKPELVVRRYVFPVGSKLGWHHHPVMNFGVVEQGELTIIGLDGKRKTIRAGEAVVEMVGTIHHGENLGDKPVVLDMHYLSQKGMPLAVQHPEIKK